MDTKSFRITLAFSLTILLSVIPFDINPLISNASGQSNGSATSAANGLANSANGLSNQVASAQTSLASNQASLASNGPVHSNGLFPHVGGNGQRQFPILKYLKNRHAANKAHIRSSPLGKLINGLRKPLSQMTGGLVPAEPHPNAVQMAAPGPQGSAAKIKRDQLESPKRLAAVQELGKVDCHWYPEAQMQLVLALRTDRSECVRYEAARILAEGNCCGGPVMAALRICVAGTEVDGNPGERSSRIREQAAIGLERCLSSSQTNLNIQPLQERPEYPISPSDNLEHAPGYSPTSEATESRVIQTSYYEREFSSITLGKSGEEARLAKLTLEKYRQLQGQSTDSIGQTSEGMRAGTKGSPRSISEAWQNATIKQ